MAKLSFRLLVAVSFLFFHFSSVAQQYKWVKGGGSDGEIQNDEEYVTHMCTDDNGNLYALSVVGDYNIEADTFFMPQAYNVAPNPIHHTLFSSYTCNGTMRFAKLIEAENYGIPTGILYNSGKIYVSGVMIGSNKRIGNDAIIASQYQTIYLSKFDTSGQYHWHKFVGPDLLSTHMATSSIGALAIDGQGNIHQYNYIRSGVQVNPSVTTQSGNYDFKYDANGNLLSAARLPLSDTEYYIRQVIFDKQTNISYALFGYTGYSSNRTFNFFAAYDANNNRLWLDSLGLGGGIANFRIRSGDGIYTSGSVSGSKQYKLGGKTVSNTSYPTGGYSTIAKLDLANGNAKWIQHIDGSTGVHYFMDVELLPGEKIAAFGGFTGKSKYNGDSLVSPPGGTIHPLFVIIDTAGNLIKHDQFVSTGGYNGGSALATDKKGNLYMGGHTYSSITAGGLTPYSTGGASDFFLMKYGFNCNCVTPTSNFTDLASGNPKIVKFTYTGTKPADSVVWDFGDGTPVVKQNDPVHTYLNGGNYNVCATAYTACGTHKKCQLVQVTLGVGDVAMKGVSVYPNPATDKLTIEGLERGTVQLYDLTGRKLLEQQITTNREAVSIQRLTPGSYLLQLSTADGGKKAMRIVKE